MTARFFASLYHYMVYSSGSRGQTVQVRTFVPRHNESRARGVLIAGCFLAWGLPQTPQPDAGFGF